MPETADTKCNPANEDKKNKQVFYKRFAPWLIAAFVIILSGIFVSGYILVTDPSERLKYWTENILSLFVLAAIVAQAVIYFQQRQLMQGQLRIMSVAVEPRLRITNVRVENLEAEREPAFIVSIMNDGATDAKDVTLNIRVNLREGDRLAMKWSRPQVVTIPARQEQHYFLQWRTALEQELIDDINGSAPLKVSGYFQLPNQEQREFCYMYYPWRGERPKGISQFIPCDFNPSLTHVMKAQTGQFKLTGGLADLTVTRAIQQEQKSEKNPPEPPPTPTLPNK